LKLRTSTPYRAHEFAETAGVTVRALHHYDRLGLLKPSHRSERGYRLYSDSDLARLEQIVVLKFLGLPLKQIRELLKDKVNLLGKLRRQQRVLVEKRRQLDRAIQAIRKAEKSLQSKCEPDWKIFRRILKEIEMQNNTDWTQKYYSEAAQAKIEKQKASWSPELQAKSAKIGPNSLQTLKLRLTKNRRAPSPKPWRLAGRSWYTGSRAEIRRSRKARTPCTRIRQTGPRNQRRTGRFAREFRPSFAMQ